MTKEIKDELIKLNVINYKQKEVCQIKQYTQCPIFKTRADGCLGCKFRYPIIKKTS